LKNSKILTHQAIWRKKIYAVIETGGKQYKVSPGQVVDVDRLLAEKGSKIELDKVLLVADSDKVIVGNPRVEGAKVLAEVVEEDRDDKIIVFKYKRKVRYRRKLGHRQWYSRLAIKEISLGQGTRRGGRRSGS
jgi:large subunit ribosomal protein L21